MRLNLIPQPLEVKQRPGQARLVPATPVDSRLDKSLKALGEEGYTLELNASGVRLRAFKAPGLFYAQQTLQQLREQGPELPCLSIKDKPRYGWRGYMLDTCRHYMPFDEIFKHLDLMASYKLNRFHWHLTEDQGWRIEIKRYPRLTSVGSWRGKGKTRHGGFYTQEQARQVVAYAAKLHIAVIPEIEIPGHSSAALTAYPEFGCTGGPYKVETIWGVFKDVYCPGKESTFRFLENILDEVCRIFPAPWFHIGGDECPKDRWEAHDLCRQRMREEGLKDAKELQSWFLRRVERMLAKRGKSMIGWDEIHEGGVPGKAIVHWWINPKAAADSTREGHQLISSNQNEVYLDHPHTAVTHRSLYNTSIAPPGLEKRYHHLVLGGEAPLWTERVPGAARADYMTWPRLCAVAENLWTAPARKNFRGFEQRLLTHHSRLKAMGAGIRDLGTPVARWTPKQVGKAWNVDLAALAPEAGRYELHFEYEQGPDPVTVSGVKFVDGNNKVGYREAEAKAIVTLKPGKATQLRLKLQPKPKGGKRNWGTLWLKPLAEA